MRIRTLLAGAFLVVTFAAAADEPKTAATAQPDPSAEAYMKAMSPGEPHKKLDTFVGTWETTVSMWMAPGTEPSKNSGVSENRWVLGGRQLEQRFKGTFMGMPFEGLGYTGYDNVRKQYVGTWMDNFSTGVMVSTGSIGADGKTFTFTGTSSDPMTGKDAPIEEKLIITDADHHTMEMWGPGPDGKMYKMMEIAYARKK